MKDLVGVDFILRRLSSVYRSTNSIVTALRVADQSSNWFRELCWLEVSSRTYRYEADAALSIIIIVGTHLP
jgi:hypothetical protein